MNTSDQKYMPAPSFGAYLLYFLIITCVLPTIYFYFKGIVLSNPIITFSIIICGYFSFIIGQKLYSPKRKKTHRLPPPVTSSGLSTFAQLVFSVCTIVVIFMVFLPLRLKYSIGVPDAPPSVSFAGWIYYLSTLGIQAALIAMFLASKEKGANFCILVASFSLYAVYEAMLGWRHGLLESAILLFVYYASSQSQTTRRRFSGIEVLVLMRVVQSTVLLALLYFLVELVLEFQLDARNARTGYAVDRIVFRFWAANFLDNTVSYFIDLGYDVFTNNQHYIALLKSGLSVAEFNNHVIYGNLFGHHHGNSKSGFGSLYIFGGLIFVVIVYFFTGMYFSFVKSCVDVSKSIFWRTLFLLHFPLLFKIINEQYEFGTLKYVAAIWLFAYLLAWLFSPKKRPRLSHRRHSALR